MNHNFSRVSDNFVVEARPVTRFPYCPTNCSKAQHVHRSTIGEPEIQPILVLIHISRGVISTQTCANNPPHYFGCRTLKKEVINCFWARAEMACGITIPSPLNHVILGEDGSLIKNAERDAGWPVPGLFDSMVPISLFPERQALRTRRAGRGHRTHADIGCRGA